MMVMIFIILGGLIGVLMIQVLLSGKLMIKSESLTPLESGFESLLSSMSVSAPFFFLALLFVLFDMELVLFFPGVISVFSEETSFIIWILINFVILITLMVEWAFCGLKWQV